jgi:hypothetical protein
MIGGGNMSPCQTQLHMYCSDKKLHMYLHGSDTYFGSMFVLIFFGKKKKDMHGKVEEKRNFLHASIYNLNTTVLNETTRRV